MPAGSYQAGSPSLFGNTGGPMAPHYDVDVPGAIDALANGTSSLIHGIYLRKQAAKTQQIEQQRVDQEHAYRTAELDRQREHDTMEADRWGREQHLREITAGVTPGTTTTAVTQGAPTPLPAVQPGAQGASPIRAAMGVSSAPPAAPFDPTGASQQPLPGIQQAATSATPATAGYTAPTPTPTTVTTPEQYDPTKAAAYVRGTETARIRADTMKEVATAREASLQAGREYMAGQAMKRLQTSIGARNGGSGGAIGKAMTGNVRENARKETAIGLLDSTNGSYDDAVRLLNEDTPTSKAWRELGVEPRHLMYAHSQYTKGAVTAATRLQAGALGATPEESVGAVERTRELVTRPKKAADGTGSSSGNAAASGPAASGTTAKGLVKPATSSEPEPTDDELRAAMKAGIKPGDAKGARAWIAKQRKTKAAKP